MLIVERSFTLVFMVFMAISVLYGVRRASNGKDTIQIRRIAGLDAMEEAVGRATESGRPLHYSTGSGVITTIGAPESLASLNILSFTAALCAKYDCGLIVTNRNPVLHTIAESVVREAYFQQGVPEEFKPESIRFVSEQQFPAAAQAMGIMERENAVSYTHLDVYKRQHFTLYRQALSTCTLAIYLSNFYQSQDPSRVSTLFGW